MGYINVVLFSLLFVVIAEGKVSDISCTVSKATCPQHSECKSTKCKCNDNYAEDTTDGNTCVLIVSATTCSQSGDECKNIQNAACDVPNTKCKCNDGFTEMANTCQKNSSGTSFRISVASFLTTFIAIWSLWP